MKRTFDTSNTVILRLALAALATAPAAGSSAETEEVYRQFAKAVVKIEVTENTSGAKALIGSGFFVHSDDILITNYHVIERLVHSPDRYQATWHPEDGAPGAVTVLALDIVHDLALVRATSSEPSDHDSTILPVSDQQPLRGQRLYSLGYPHDLSQTIVEGTYNGLLENSLYEKIHFTGSINSGMSGGPTITEEGKVVGVNVATAGEQVGFLVPSSRVSALVRAWSEQTRDATAEELVTEARRQIYDHQQLYFGDLFVAPSDSAETQFEMGPFRVPTKPKTFFECWGDGSGDDWDMLYQHTEHQCSTGDVLFISGSHSSGVVKFRHRWLQSEELGVVRFYNTYEHYFSQDVSWLWAGDDDVTEYRCTNEFIDHSGLVWSGVLCLRAYRDLEGLYDAIFKLASLQGESEGLATSLVLGGVSFETADQIVRRYLESISWQPSS